MRPKTSRWVIDGLLSDMKTLKEFSCQDSSPNFVEVLRWAEGQLGYYQVRDATGTMLAEVDAV
jgi:hypothetical protein